MNKLYTDIHYIRRYVNGELSPKEMFELERAAQEDEMIMDIIMGIEFEKSHHLPDNIAEIRLRIKDRVIQTKPVKTFFWTKWSIAASILLAIGITAYIFLSQQDQSTLSTIAYQIPEEPSGDHQAVGQHVEDTTYISKNNDKDDIVRQPALDKLSYSKDTVQKELHRSEQQIAARSSDPSTLSGDNFRKPDVTYLNLQKTGKSKEIRHTEIAGNDTINPVMEEISLSYKIPQKDSLTRTSVAAVQSLKNQNVQAKIEQKIHTDSPEQLRAKLNNMNIDPQTSMVLNQVLNQQNREKMSSVEIVENKSLDLTLADRNYTYLANIKSSENRIPKEKKDSNVTEPIQTIAFGKESKNEISKQITSVPVNGWKAFDNYLGQALSAHGITSGHLKFEFKLDNQGKPEHIQIIYSDNKNIDPILIDILQKGPVWKPGKDADKVTLELKF